ncbi:hypothetical protein llap_11810 [Limosa lapponica baueri]|uniref:Uncharacterized protein n=1 Tax=Limosa lapponica baueri TaxID=1758121 RepID=A0A2I0TVQ6_LIMLA|nr:hypothetical protein llap_11810 [Limosa lapponica baueri]
MGTAARVEDISWRAGPLLVGPQLPNRGMDMEQRDYDSRTALHVAAAEGHVDVVKFLLEACKVNPFPKDRWNNTPMDEALHFGHHDVFKILQEYQVQYTPSEDSNDGKENRTVHKNLDGLL